MDTIKKPEDINQPRRRFFGTAALTIASAQLALNSFAEAQPSKAEQAGVRSIKPGTNTSFGPLKQIDAGLLNVGYAEAGLPMVRRSFFCTAGPMTFTAL